MLLKKQQKIVALIPVRNESQYIAFCLRAIAKFADAICISDEASDDNTLEIIESLAVECRIERILKKQKWNFNETERRQSLLDAGREIGGTHFIIFDADEAFTSNFLENNLLRNEILKLHPGDCLELVSIQLWRSLKRFRYDTSIWTNHYKAFIFADDNKCYYHEQIIHLERVPSNISGKTYRIEGYKYGVLHFSFVNWQNLLIKQAWYRCLEHIMHPQKPVQEINALYATTKDETNIGLLESPSEWFAGYEFFDEVNYKALDTWREKQVLNWFEQYGQEYFAELDIWDIDWGGVAKVHRSIASTLKDTIHRPITVNEYEMLQKVERIGGWFSSAEILAIYRAVKSLPNNAKILEIGSYRGRSTNAIGYAVQGSAREIYCLDIWRDFENQGIRQSDQTAHLLPPTNYAIFEDFLRNTEWFSDQLRILRGSTKQLQEILPQKFFDLIFIGGAHDYENVFRDIKISLKCLKPGGIICGHDYHTHGGQDVIEAVHELVFSSKKFSETGVFSGTTIWYARCAEQDICDIDWVDDGKISVQKLQFSVPKINPVPEKVHRPFWSVMIPTYNGTKYLEQTLNSILEQDPGSNEMQIEVIDDCSTNDEPELIVRKIGQDRINFIRQPHNIGQLANWNACIERARGHWIHILHQDDFVMPGFYSRLQQGLEKEPNVGAAFCRYSYIDENDNWLNLSFLERETPGILSNWLERIAMVQRVQFPSIVVKRSAYEHLGGFCPQARSAADWEMWKRIAVHYPIWYEPQILACFRLHSASESSRLIKTGANIADTRRAIEISHSYLPNTIADELSSRAREFYALDTFNKASKMLDQHSISAAIAQIREGLKCSDSPEVMRSLTSLLTATQSLPLLKVLASLLLSAEFDQILALLPDERETHSDEEFELRDINLIIFPDWEQPEELLYQNLANVISSLVTHPDQHTMKLFIENSVISDEDANLLLSGVIFNLLQETNLDITEELEISIISNLTERQWKFLLQRIQARIILTNENKSVIQQIRAESIPSYELEKLDTQIRVDLLCY